MSASNRRPDKGRLRRRIRGAPIAAAIAIATMFVAPTAAHAKVSTPASQTVTPAVPADVGTMTKITSTLTVAMKTAAAIPITVATIVATPLAKSSPAVAPFVGMAYVLGFALAISALGSQLQRRRQGLFARSVIKAASVVNDVGKQATVLFESVANFAIGGIGNRGGRLRVTT